MLKDKTIFPEDGRAGLLNVFWVIRVPRTHHRQGCSGSLWRRFLLGKKNPDGKDIEDLINTNHLLPSIKPNRVFNFVPFDKVST